MSGSAVPSQAPARWPDCSSSLRRRSPPPADGRLRRLDRDRPCRSGCGSLLGLRPLRPGDPPTGAFSAVSAGEHHTCGLRANGARLLGLQLLRPSHLKSIERLSAATAALAADGADVRYLGSSFVPDEESCFCRFESGSIDAVRLACERASFSYARILEARPEWVEGLASREARAERAAA